MIKIPPNSRKHIGVTLFKWGIYLHWRWNYNFKHCKLAFWTQSGIRVSTRRQVKEQKMKPRYVRAFRFSLSWWSSKNGKKGKPFNLGFLFYAGRTPPS